MMVSLQEQMIFAVDITGSKASGRLIYFLQSPVDKYSVIIDFRTLDIFTNSPNIFCPIHICITCVQTSWQIPLQVVLN